MTFRPPHVFSLEAVDAWHSLLARYIPSSPRVPRVLLGHKADLPQSSYVVSDRALDAFVRDAGLTDWCYTVGHEEFGDYVAHRGFEVSSIRRIANHDTGSKSFKSKNSWQAA